jgi:hypothetical protein
MGRGGGGGEVNASGAECRLARYITSEACFVGRQLTFVDRKHAFADR